MSSIDTLISNATSRANGYASGTETLVAELRSFIQDANIHVTPPPDTELSTYTLPPYVPPVERPTPDPVYEPTTLPFPTSPSLTGVGSVTLPAARTEPTVNTTGLFDFTLPSTNLPTLNETEPDMRIDQLVAEMDVLVTPRISDFTFPEVHAFIPGALPDVTLPVYDAPPVPDTLADPASYNNAFEAAYARMAPEMQAFINDKVSNWVSEYAPEYSSWVTLLKAKVDSGMDGGALPDQFEAAMFTRAQGRVQREFEAVTSGIYNNFARSGLMEPPGTVNANLLVARLKNAEALANQSTDIYIERRKSEVQHAQFVMNLAAGQIASVRNTAIAYAQAVGNTLNQARSYADSVAEKMGHLYEHLIARANLSVSILHVVDAQYASKLKAALAAYDGYRLALDAERARTELDNAKINQIQAQIQAEGLSINKFSALIDAIARKASLEELKIKEYGIRADIFSNKIKAQLASFDVYQAAMNGDKSKLDGEMSKITVFDRLVKMDEVNLDAQVKQIAALQSVNDAKVQVFKSGADMYERGMDTAINKFQAQAEVKKLAQSLYGQELMNAIEQYKVGMEMPRLMIDAILKQYSARLEAAIKSAELEVSKLNISEHASVAAVGAYQAMASSALGSLNTVASSAIQASE